MNTSRTLKHLAHIPHQTIVEKTAKEKRCTGKRTLRSDKPYFCMNEIDRLTPDEGGSVYLGNVKESKNSTKLL